MYTVGRSLHGCPQHALRYDTLLIRRPFELQDIPFYFPSTYNTRGKGLFMKSRPAVPLKPPAALYNHTARVHTMTQIPRVSPINPSLPAILPKTAHAVSPHLQDSRQTMNLTQSRQCNISRGSARYDSVCDVVNAVSYCKLTWDYQGSSALT